MITQGNYDLNLGAWNFYGLHLNFQVWSKQASVLWQCLQMYNKGTVPCPMIKVTWHYRGVEAKIKDRPKKTIDHIFNTLHQFKLQQTVEGSHFTKQQWWQCQVCCLSRVFRVSHLVKTWSFPQLVFAPCFGPELPHPNVPVHLKHNLPSTQFYTNSEFLTTLGWKPYFMLTTPNR